MKTNNTKISTSQMALTATMAAVTCVLGPLSIPIPISPVPITLTNFAIYLTACLLGWKLGTISYLIYLVIGMIGLPVFSGFTSGFGKLLGPTGGYLIGFIFTAAISGYVFEKTQNRAIQAAGMILGGLVVYVFGTAWLCFEAHMTFIQGLWAGVIPYIPGDLTKIVLVMVLGPVIQKRLAATGLVPLRMQA